MAPQETAVVVGVGPGLGAALGRRFAAAGMRVVLAARRLDRVEAITGTIGPAAEPRACDATDEAAVRDLFRTVEAAHGTPTLVVFNASGRVRKPLLEIETEEFERAWRAACLGGFLVGREAARAMLPQGRGSILFTGATASVKAFAGSAGFAVGKFGLRALAQSMARELGPEGIHVAHVVIDGGILGPHHTPDGSKPEDHLLGPDAIAETYLHLHRQHRSAWAQEVDLRPWVERF